MKYAAHSVLNLIILSEHSKWPANWQTEMRRSLTLRVVGENEKVHTGRTGPGAKDGDSLRISSKVADVFI